MAPTGTKVTDPLCEKSRPAQIPTLLNQKIIKGLENKKLAGTNEAYRHKSHRSILWEIFQKYVCLFLLLAQSALFLEIEISGNFIGLFSYYRHYRHLLPQVPLIQYVRNLSKICVSLFITGTIGTDSGD